MRFFLEKNVSFQSFSDQPGNQQTRQLYHPTSHLSTWPQDSDDDGSVHLGEVLASQTAARAPPGAPANAVPGPPGKGLKEVFSNRR